MRLPAPAGVEIADLDANVLREATAGRIPVAAIVELAGIEVADRQTVLGARQATDAVGVDVLGA